MKVYIVHIFETVNTVSSIDKVFAQRQDAVDYVARMGYQLGTQVQIEEKEVW